MCQGILRVEGDSLLEFAGVTVVVRAEAAQMLNATQQTIIGRQAAGAPGSGRPDLRVLESGLPR